MYAIELVVNNRALGMKKRDSPARSDEAKQIQSLAKPPVIALLGLFERLRYSFKCVFRCATTVP